MDYQFLYLKLNPGTKFRFEIDNNRKIGTRLIGQKIQNQRIFKVVRVSTEKS